MEKKPNQSNQLRLSLFLDENISPYIQTMTINILGLVLGILEILFGTPMAMMSAMFFDSPIQPTMQKVAACFLAFGLALSPFFGIAMIIMSFYEIKQFTWWFKTFGLLIIQAIVIVTGIIIAIISAIRQTKHLDNNVPTFATISPQNISSKSIS